MDSPADTTPNAEMLERLTAYLDGEPDAVESREVEARIAAEASWADELRRLQRAWDFLDRLPRADASADFTRTTVEMAAFDAVAAVEQIAHPQPARRWGDVLLAVAGVLVAAVGGFLAVEHLAPQRDDSLLRDLPFYRHYEVYARTEPGETAEFFRLLREKRIPLTPPPTPVETKPGGPVDGR